MRIAKLCMVYAAALAASAARANAETVVLKNGSRIEGTVLDERDTKGHVVVEFQGMGRMYLRAAEVARIERASEAGARFAAVPGAEGASPGDFVAVTLPAKRDVVGAGTYYGVLSAESTAATVVLEVPGAGKIKIQNVPGLAVRRSDAMVAGLRPPAGAPAERTIRTTHVVHLANGRTIAGTLVETAASEPVKLKVGERGCVLIPRAAIGPEGIEAAERTIELGPEPEAAPPAPTEEAGKEGEIENLKDELRREILEDVERILEERLGARAAEAIAPRGAEVVLSVEDVQWIEQNLYELTRWRTRNRVRAERHLRAMGSAVLPYLERVAAHPFWLTRRAVQRIVRDIGDVRGAPLAIRSLNDEDYYVRAIAHEALKALLPSEILYNPSGPERQRLSAMAEYRELWERASSMRLRDAVLAGAIR
ncbi:MAG: hypothetical protein ACUVYA_18635 [Planctomycetota bacterium]